MAARLQTGGRIDRGRRLRFRFDGKEYTGFHGDTLASALIANDVHVVGRGFKWHRPRGVLTAGSEEPNALVTLETGAFAEPNARATQIELYDGLTAASQNAWPSRTFDVAAAWGLLAGVLPPGFYYKTFKWPRWEFYEGAIRKAAGLGKAPRDADGSIYDKQTAHCDLFIVGAGPAGLSAALAASETGARIIIADEQSEPGGSLLWEDREIGGQPAMQWVASAVGELAARDNVTLMTRATVTGYYDHNLLAVVERLTDHLGPAAPDRLVRQRLWKIRADRVILATGAIERPLVFPNNDRPRIMMASAVRQYIGRHGVLPGHRPVIVTNNDSAYDTALALDDCGAKPAAVVDYRPRPVGQSVEAARGRGIEIIPGACVIDTKGRSGVRAVLVARLDSDGGLLAGTTRRIGCDLLCMSGGWNPNVGLFSQSGGKLRFDEVRACFVPSRSVQDEISVGAANGIFDLEGCLEQGGPAGNVTPRTEASDRPVWRIKGRKPAKQFVDFQYDVTVEDIEIAARENFVSVEHLKRYTTVGMSIDQGRTSNVNALAVLAEATGRAIGQVGTTTFRPPYSPVTMGVMAGPDHGALFRPTRQLPAQDGHRDNGARFEDFGGWSRPGHYARAGEISADSIHREAVAARAGVALFDASPLGKIEVRGPDAGEFLNRIYINDVLSLEPGQARYGLMLNEQGVVMDDGVFARVETDFYYLATTSGGAERIAFWLEEWLRCEWTELQVLVTPVTVQWATLAIMGPKARDVLARLEPDIDLSARAFPHMAFREARIGGVRARIARISYSGELCFEVNVPANYGLSLWRALMEAGRPDGIAALGIDALNCLRTEKGYIHLGVDTDGETTPDDIGWGAVARGKTTDFIGKRSLARPENMRPDRLNLVGLESADGRALPSGAQILAGQATAPPADSDGFVTSSHVSPALGRPVALALLRRGRQRHGETVGVYSEGEMFQAVVAAPCAYDPGGERLNA